MPPRSSVLVLYIHSLDTLPGGTQRRVWHLLKGVAAAGWDVNVLVPGPAYEVHERLGVRFWTYRAPSRTELQGRGFRGFSRQVYHDLVAPSMIRVARHVIETESISLVQAEHVWTALPAARIAYRTGLPWIYDSHAVEVDIAETSSSKIYRSYVRFLEKRACRRADLILAVSDRDGRRFQTLYGVNAGRVSIVPNGVDVPRIAGAPAGPPDGLVTDGYLMFHGTYQYGPNRAAFLWIVKSLAPWLGRHHPRLRILLAGDDPPKVPLPSNVVAPGYLPDDALYRALRGALAAIVPVTAGSGTRMKVLEYMAAGKGIVSTEKGVEGLPIVSGEHALVCKDLDDGFMSAIDRVTGDSLLRTRLGEEAQRLAWRYDWTRVTEMCLEAYRSVL